MSLVNAMMTPCAFMLQSKNPDGEGGNVTTWSEGATFDAAIVMQSSALATVADAIKETRSYTVTVSKDVSLKYGNVIKRLHDGAFFRITSETEDKATPQVSALNLAQATAERWELTT